MNPFDLKSALLARHAQHVVLIHFPIALFITGVAFDLVAAWRRNNMLAAAAYYNLALAAITAIPAAATGLLAWQMLFDGKTPRGNLRLHMILGFTSVLVMWLVWAMKFRARRRLQPDLSNALMVLEAAAVLLVAFTGHVGGFLSGVNGGG
jgi:uncharacterized membrane protein